MGDRRSQRSPARGPIRDFFNFLASSAKQFDELGNLRFARLH